MEKRYKYIIFDLDGTLLDTDLYVALNYDHLYAKFKPESMPRLAKLIYFSGPTLDEVFAKEFPEYSPEELYAEFLDYSKKHANTFATMYEGERECLDQLIASGYKLSVCTSKRMAAMKANFEHFDLLKYFDHLIGYDSVSKRKPDPEGILKCISLYNASKDEILYIGDSETDVEAGRRAGVDTALVTWGLKKLDLASQPLLSFASFSEIEDYLCHK